MQPVPAAVPTDEPEGPLLADDCSDVNSGWPHDYGAPQCERRLANSEYHIPANGAYLASISDSGIESGWIALVTSSKGMQTHFDHLVTCET